MKQMKLPFLSDGQAVLPDTLTPSVFCLILRGASAGGAGGAQEGWL